MVPGLVYRLLFAFSALLPKSASLALASSPLLSPSRFLPGCLAPSRPGDAGSSVLSAASPLAAASLGGRASSALGGTSPSSTPGGRGGGPGGRFSPGGGRSSPGSGAPLVTYPVLDEGSGAVPPPHVPRSAWGFESRRALRLGLIARFFGGTNCAMRWGGSTLPNALRLRRGTPYAQPLFRLLGQLPLRRLGVAEEGGKIGVPAASASMAYTSQFSAPCRAW